MLNSLPVRLLWRSFNHLTRLMIATSAIIALLCAITIIAMRYWLLPDIEQFHDRITASLSAAMGNPVSIGKIEGDWNGLYPHLNMTDVRILDEQKQPALVLPGIDAKVSWLSLFAAELRLSSLEIDSPELLIRRDVGGKTFIGSVALSSQGTDNNLANWLLHQSRMVVNNATIVWVDEQRDAPALVLNQVNLRIENLFSHHQFALRAVPPAELATPLDVRGDFHGKSFDDLKGWNGQLFAQLDYTDLLAWRPWLRLPEQLSNGRGAMRAWLGMKDGKLSQFTADLSLRDVSTRLGENVPTMDVNFLHGRAAWKTVDDGWEVATQHLSMRLKNGLRLQPTDFYFRSIPGNDTHPASGELRANLLQLEGLVSLSNFLPLDADMRNQLNAYAPRGRVSNLEMQWQAMPKKHAAQQVPQFKIKGQFNNLALRQVGEMPGFSGLSATVDGSDASGKLTIKSHNMTLDANGAMREPLLFDNLTGQLSWQREAGEWVIKLDNVAVSNDDLAGNLYGGFHTKTGTLGVLDLTISLTRGDLRRAARYTPLVALDKKDNDWLNAAMLSGHTEDFRLRIKGNLSDFPLDGKKDGLFEVSAHGEDVAVAFAEGWPIIKNISGEFSIRGNKLEVHTPAATMLDANIRNLSITLPDMANPDMPMEIKGEAAANNQTFLDFIQQSPVHGYINGFTDGMNASGDGQLDLFARIHLLSDKPVNITGTLRVKNSDIDMGAGAPILRNTRGTLSFTESGMQAKDISANILGGPAHLDVMTAEGGVVNASVQGRADLDVLHNTESHPLLDYLHGGTNWNAKLSLVNKTAQIVVNSSLQGIRSTLPPPFAKRSNEVWPLHIEKKNIAEHQDKITAQLGKLVNMDLQRSEENGVSVIKRGMIVFGEPVKLADAATGKNAPSTGLRTGYSAALKPAALAASKPGIWVSGKLPVLSLQGWEGVFASTLPNKDGANTDAALPLTGGNLHIDKLIGYGLSLNDMQISVAKRGAGVAAQFSGTDLNGEVIWQPHGFGEAGKVSAQLRNLYWHPDDTPAPLSPKTTTTALNQADVLPPSPPVPGELPALELAVEDLQFKGKHIGRLEITGHPEGQDWRLRRLRLTNPDGSVSGDGIWHGEQGNTQTELNLALEISNAGKILARSGYPDTVKNGSGKLLAKLNWDGQPDAFNYAKLNGTLTLDTGKGQFLKMDPGMGKLLSVLSLQALPKRIALDFTDVFSDGFEFTNINGHATIKRGVMETQDLHIDGSSAKVTMKGSVNLNNETQDLRVEVLPTLGNSVSLLSAFAAGPVVGIGTFIVSKMLGNPLDKLISFEYNISGTWNDPKIVKLGEKSIALLAGPKKADVVEKTDVPAKADATMTSGTPATAKTAKTPKNTGKPKKSP